MTDIDILDNIENAYAERLAQRATEWQTKHPAEAKQLREDVTAKYRRAGKPDPEPGSFPWLMLEAAVVEAIRAKKGWPTLREFERLQAGHETPSPPIMPLRKPVAPTRDYDDRKAAAAGERP